MGIHDCQQCGQRYFHNDDQAVHLCRDCEAVWQPVDQLLPVWFGVDTAATLGNTDPALAKSSAGCESLKI